MTPFSQHGRLFLHPAITPGAAAAFAPVVTSPDLLRRARELDEALQLQPGHGILQITLEAILADIAAADFERVLCGWSFRQGEAWAEGILELIRRRWAEEDARRHPPAPWPA